MRNQHLVREWLKRARSSLERAKAGKVSEAVIYEDLCFDCQQAVEKSQQPLLNRVTNSLLYILRNTGKVFFLDFRYCMTGKTAEGGLRVQTESSY